LINPRRKHVGRKHVSGATASDKVADEPIKTDMDARV